MQNLSKRSGITLIELLLVIALVVIVAGASTPFLSRFLTQTNHDTTIDNLIGSLRKAQSYAMDGRNSETWGVCIFSSEIRMYSGSCGSPSYSEVFAIPGSVSVSNFSDVTFNQRGEPSSSVNASVTTAVDTNAVTVLTSGGMEVE